MKCQPHSKIFKEIYAYVQQGKPLLAHIAILLDEMKIHIVMNHSFANHS